MTIIPRPVERRYRRPASIGAPAAFALLAIAAQTARAQDHFTRADAYADAAPRSVEQSVPSLAAYLARSGRDELTRSRTLYRWVTRNIEYDATGFRSGNYGDLSPEGVLRRRVSVCDGYSHLVQALGVAMGLQVEVVRGWSKGYSYAAGQRFNGRENHSWNAVRIDGQWRLMDATWGSGYLDERLKFFRDFQEHYFLTSPDAFIFDHFPSDPRWELLDRPLSMAEFTDLVYLRPMFFQAGFRIQSHSHALIEADHGVTVTLGVTRPVEISAQLVDGASDRPIDDGFAFAQVDDTHAEISAAFPRPGNYLIRVFARPRGAAGPLDWVLDYRVNASGAARDAVFPVPYSGFATTGSWLYGSMSGSLHPGQSYRFRLRVPGASEVMLDNAGRRTSLTRAGDEFAGDVSAARGEAVLYARYGDGGYVGLLRYFGR